MSTQPDDDKVSRQRAETLRRFEEQQQRAVASAARGSRIKQYRAAAWESTKRQLPFLEPVGKILKWGVIKPVEYLAVKPAMFVAKHGYTYKDKEKHRHFSPVRALFTTAALATTIAFRTYIAMGAYYYGTLKTYNDVYVPNAGVFVNQQFEHPNVPGRTATPRDEIHTVLGKHLEDGKLESFRADIDSNLWFFWKRAAWRPDYLAADITPQSPYGAMCKFEVTGGYTLLPRPLRFIAKNWAGARPEIIDGSCTQLKEVPPQYVQVDAPGAKSQASPMAPLVPATAPGANTTSAAPAPGKP